MSITSLGKFSNNGKLYSPEETLKDALSDVGVQGALKDGKKCLVLALDESNGEYKINFYQAGMKMSECMALCEIAKSLFLEQMGY